MIKDKLYVAVTTVRNGRLRIISVRRARKAEVILHGSRNLK